MFIVTLIWLWPRISMTTRGETPWTSSKVAHECRRSWKRIGLKPARARSRLNDRIAFRLTFHEIEHLTFIDGVYTVRFDRGRLDSSGECTL